MIDFNFKFIGLYDITNIFKSLSSLIDAEWDKYTFRQDDWETHRETKTIPVLYDRLYSHRMGTKSEYYHIFESDIKNIQNILRSFYGTNGEIIRVEIVSMPPRSKVRLHVDNNYSLKTDNRIHLPLKTNPNVIFTVGDEDKNLMIGELWEINNSGKLHGVANDGDEDRIHMIIDFKSITKSLI